MSYSNIVNSAISYFALLGSFIDDQYQLNPAGIIYPGELGTYLRMKKVNITGTGAKAHAWVLNKLNQIINEIEGSYPTLNLLRDSEIIFEAYKNIKYSSYIAEVNAEVLYGAKKRWQQRAAEYEMKGDDASWIYCARKVENLEYAIATGTPVATFENDPLRIQYLDEMIGRVTQYDIDKNLIKK